MPRETQTLPKTWSCWTSSLQYEYIYISIYIYVCVYIWNIPGYIWPMAYYRPLTISQNIVFPNKIATSSQSDQSIPAAYVFLMALIWLVKIWYHKMDGLRSIPVPQFIPVLVESDIRVAYKYHHISTIPYSKQP